MAKPTGPLEVKRSGRWALWRDQQFEEIHYLTEDQPEGLPKIRAYGGGQMVTQRYNEMREAS